MTGLTRKTYCRKVEQEPGQQFEREPGQEHAPEEEILDVLGSGQEEIEVPEPEASIVQEEVLPEWPYTKTSVQYLAKDSPQTQGLTSSYVRPVLAAFLLDSSLSLPLQSSYYQVVRQQGQDVALSDGSTVVLAKLSPSLLETLSDR